LSVTDRGRGLGLSAFLCSQTAHSETDRDVGHGVEHHTLVLRHVLRHASKVCLEDVVTVQVAHLTAWLDPHLVGSELCDVVEGSDVQSELAAVGKLTEAGSGADEVLARDTGCKTHQVLAHVVDTVLL